MNWQDKLADQIPIELGREIDVYETQLELRRLGKIDEKLFAETRLRRGAYGQRYDNGQRHDGFKTQHLAYPSAPLTNHLRPLMIHPPPTLVARVLSADGSLPAPGAGSVIANAERISPASNGLSQRSLCSSLP